MARALAALLLALAAPASARPGPPASPPIRPAARSLDAIRDEARAVVLVQSILSWYTRTVGEPPAQAETYKGHEALFSKESIAAVAAALRSAASDDERRALQFLKSYLAAEYLARETARFDDQAQAAELETSVALSWEKRPVPYKQLEILAGNERDAARRAEIESRRAEVWRVTLNPILERKEREAQRLARDLGYPSYLALAEEYRMVDLKRLIADSERFRAATENTYAALLADVARKELGADVASLRRSDIARLRKAARFSRFFPKELMVPSFRHFLAGIGLDLKTAGGAEIRIDDSLHPLKEPRAACYAIRVPDDVRITVKPTGGIDDFVTFFHEGGHALHYANTTTKVWEFQQLGPYVATEGFAETFGHVWDEPAWLARYRDFVAAWNREHKTSFPTMSDADIREVVRQRVFEELYFLRRYGAAKLIYEAALHGGDPATWSAVYPGPIGDLAALYRALFGRAYGFPLTDEDALRFRTDVDDLLYAADYTRAFALANLAHEALRARIGPGWLTDPRAGAALRALFAEGDKLQPDEIARALGHERLDLAPSEARFRRLLGP